MHPKELETVIKLEASKRYEYFIKKVVDQEEVWGLYNSENGWANVGDDDNNVYIAVWPKKEFAELCVNDDWMAYEPKTINLYDFIEKWLSGMKHDGLKPFVFLTPEGNGVPVETDRLLNDLKAELEKY